MFLGSDYSALASAAAAFIIAFVALGNVLGRALRQHFVSKQTALNDIPKLGQPPNRKDKIRGTAVISGGSIAGLWAARVCADHFERVVVIEHEPWLFSNQTKFDAEEFTTVEIKEHDGLKTVINKRTRVPQYQATHGFQPIAVMALRKLFPRFDEVAREMNIPPSASELHFHNGGVPLNTPYHEYPEGYLPDVMVATRAQLETLLRKLVRESDACHNVHFVNGAVTGVVPSPTRPSRLEGVQVRLDGHKEAQIMTGELFIDCTGPTQAFFKLLPRTGFGTGGPKSLADLRLHYEQRMKYSCVQFELTPEMQTKLSATIPPNPHATSSSYLREGWGQAEWLYALHPIAEIDNKMSLGKTRHGGKIVEITVGGWGIADPPRNKAQILEFMHSMVMAPGYNFPAWINDLFDVLCDESGEEPIVGFYPSPSSTFIEYHRAENLPSNFIATGDAVMQLNPVFGQGCSKACIGAVTLDAALRNVRSDTLPDGFGKNFFKAHADRVIGLWEQAKAQDYRFETTKPIAGEEAMQEKLLLTQGGFMNSYMLSLFKLNQTDKHVASTLWHIFCFLAPATDLFAPRILVKVAWAKLWGIV